MSKNLDVRRKLLDFPKVKVPSDYDYRPQLEEIIINGSLVLVDPIERMAPYKYQDFNLSTLVDNGVDLKDMPTIGLDRIDAVRYASNLYVNLEKVEENLKNN